MGNVLMFNGITTQPIPVDRVCDAAKECGVVLILGKNREGNPYYASSIADKAEILLIVEEFKYYLMEGQGRD